MHRRNFLAGLAAGALAPVASTTTADAAPATSVDPHLNWGAWQGWGTSLSWWANIFGERDDLADMFFTTRTVRYQGQSLPGLGLNIVRYNAGATTSDTLNGAHYQPTDPPYKRIEGFWRNWYSADPNSSRWDWSVDARQRSMLTNARDRGADRFELFSDSPLWWMCLNHSAEGNNNGGNNLQPWNYRQHAVYLATIACYARDHWGVDFQSIEPFNEPSAHWWRPDGKQEGCHFDIPTQKTVLGHLRSELDARGLRNTVIAASDENTYDQARATWQNLADAQRSIGKINTHGYQYTGGRRDLLYNTAHQAGKTLWNSEYGDGDPSGTTLARNLMLDFQWLHPSAWVYWQAVDNATTWGLINSSEDTDYPHTATVNPKYYVLAQFSRHIRPGIHILSSPRNTVAAYDPTQRRLVIVANNTGNGQYLGFDLSRFATAAGDHGLVHRWITSSHEHYAYHADTQLHGRSFWSWFPPNAIQTFEITNVTP